MPRGALDLDRPAHQVQQPPGDGEPEAGAAVLAGGGAVGLLEGGEQRRRLGAGHADAGVFDAGVQRDRRRVQVPRRQAQVDLSLGGELDGVADQVVEDLPQPQGVAEQGAGQFRRERRAQAQALVLGRQGEQFQYVAEQFGQVERVLFQFQPAGLDLGRVEDVVEQAQQGLRGRPHLFQVLVLARRQFGVQHQMGQPEDGVHRRADLVAHVRQKIALGPVRRLGFMGADFEVAVHSLENFAILDHFVDVDARANVAEEAAIAAVAWRTLIEYPAILAIMPAQAVFHPEGFPGVEGAEVNVETARQVIRVDAFRPAVAGFLLQRAAGKVQPDLVEEVAAFIQPRHPDQHGGGIGDLPEALLALA